MKKLNWGLVSTGVIAKNFARTAAKMLDEMTLYGVASRTASSASAFASEFGIGRSYGSYEDMARDPDIDIVYIATPHSLHCENMLLFLEHGKHVLCEKSFTVNKAEAERVFSLAREKNLFIMEAFWTKFAPAYEELAKLLNDGVIGEISGLTAQYGFKPSGTRLERKMDPALAGGALLDIGVYVIGFACMMLGYEPHKILSTVKLCGMGTDEYENIILQYENGKTANLIASIGTVLPVVATLYGTEGRIEIKDFKSPQSFEVTQNDGKTFTVEKLFEINGFEYEIREVTRCIAEGRTESSVMPPRCTAAVMGIMDDLRRQWGLKYPCE